MVFLSGLEIVEFSFPVLKNLMQLTISISGTLPWLGKNLFKHPLKNVELFPTFCNKELKKRVRSILRAFENTLCLFSHTYTHILFSPVIFHTRFDLLLSVLRCVYVHQVMCSRIPVTIHVTGEVVSFGGVSDNGEWYTSVEVQFLVSHSQGVFSD